MSIYYQDDPCPVSDYQTDDRLSLLERDFQTDPEDVGPVDVAWLLSEVRRYRDEQSPHVAAKYWAMIQAQRQTIENQAATIKIRDATIRRIEHQVDTWMGRKDKYTAEAELAVGMFGEGIQKILRGES